MSGNIPWLTVLWLVPLAGSVLIILLPPAWRELAKWTGLFVSGLTLAVAIVVTVGFDTTDGAPYQFGESHRWIPAFGAGYTLGVDGSVNALAALVSLTSNRLRRMQTGFARNYALSMLAGAALVVALLLAVQLW